MAPKEAEGQKAGKSTKAAAEKKPAGKGVKGGAEKKPKEGGVKKKSSRKGTETYKMYIYKVLKQVSGAWLDLGTLLAYTACCP